MNRLNRLDDRREGAERRSRRSTRGLVDSVVGIRAVLQAVGIGEDPTMTDPPDGYPAGLSSCDGSYLRVGQMQRTDDDEWMF